MAPVDEHQGNRIVTICGVGTRRVGVGSAGHDEELPKRDALKTPPPSLYKFSRLRDSNLLPESAFDCGLHKGFIVASIVGDWAKDSLRPCEADSLKGMGILHKSSCIAPLPARLAGSRGWHARHNRNLRSITISTCARRFKRRAQVKIGGWEGFGV